MTQAPVGIGSRRRRVEDPPLLAGRGRYAGDLCLPGMAHLVAVRSPLARARIERIGVDAARQLPGVLAVWTAADLPERARTVAEDFVPPGLERFPRPVLAGDEVRYGGEILAVIVAETPAVAADAAELVELDLEPEPAAGTVEAAIAPGAPAVHSEVPDNLGFTSQAAFGDVD
ncbi:MAG: xanthine dehydrogenase family protein molybdopterin-binding subunit, partial [Candidatus Dormibacteraceae bacterium]